MYIYIYIYAIDYIHLVVNIQKCFSWTNISIGWKPEFLECSHLFEEAKRIASFPMLSQYGEQYSVKSEVHSRTSVILMLSMNTPRFYSGMKGSACCATLKSYLNFQ